MLTWFRRGFLALVVLSFTIILTVFVLMRQSLPLLDGEVKAEGISTAVFVDRDDQGIPLISGSNRQDVCIRHWVFACSGSFFFRWI